MEIECRIDDLSNKLREVVIIDKDGIPRFPPEALPILNEIKDRFIQCVLGKDVDEAKKWIAYFINNISSIKERLNLAGFTFPRELNSFISDPMQHLRKKLFNYIYDLARGKISFDEFSRRASAAIRTSLRTNMRSIYQLWGLTSILGILATRGYDVVYPEHRFLNFDRSGKQKLGIIPPNFVLLNLGKGYLSFFHEAPRPLGWEDTSDLQRVWKLYTALRPDVLVYGGKVLNIVDLSGSIPIKRPNIVLEFKELEDWFIRVRDLKGYFRKPLTAEEWRSKWLEGLFDGLADIMGVKRSEVREQVEKGVSLRVREYQLVKLYRSTYNPDTMILIARTLIPNDIKKELEESNIVVYDNIGFNPKNLEPVVDDIERYASFEGADRITITISLDIARLLDRAREKMNTHSIEDTLRHILMKVLNSEV